MQDSRVTCQSAFEIDREVAFVSIRSFRIVDLVVVVIQFGIRNNIV